MYDKIMLFLHDASTSWSRPRIRRKAGVERELQPAAPRVFVWGADPVPAAAVAGLLSWPPAVAVRKVRPVTRDICNGEPNYPKIALTADI